VERMVFLLKEELEEIFDWLEGKITPENREWLEKHRSGVWGDTAKDSPVLWRARHIGSIRGLSSRIQEIVAAKLDGVPIDYALRGGLSRKTLDFLAEMLKIHIPEGTTKRDVVGLILEKIREEKSNKEVKDLKRSIKIP